jgi:hypothetical protein
MSFSYQLFNQDFISSELIYLPPNASVNKIITCKDGLGQMEWSNLSSIAVVEAKSTNANILINGDYNVYKSGSLSIALTSSLTNLSSVNTTSLTVNNIYGDFKMYTNINLNNNNINNVGIINSQFCNGDIGDFRELSGSMNYFDNLYELTPNNKIIFNNHVNLNNKSIYNVNTIYTNNIGEYTTSNNIKFINNVDLNNNNIINGNSISSTNLYGSIQTSSQPYILTLDNVIKIGNLNNVNQSTILPYTSSINLGSSLLPFLSVQSTSVYNSNQYVDNIYEKTASNKIIFNNDIKLSSSSNIVFNGVNTSSIGSSSNMLNSIYSNNLYVTSIYELSTGNNITLRNNTILAGSILYPSADNSSSIGSTSSKFANGYFYNTYIDKIYESKTSSGINIMNDLYLNAKSINGVYTINCDFSTGIVTYFKQNSITVMQNLSTAGVLRTLDSNVITTVTSSTISLGSVSNLFLNSYFSGSVYSANIRVNSLYENTSSNNINLMNKLVCNAVNIEPLTNNTCSLGDSNKLFNIGYITNIYTSVIGSVDAFPITIINDTNFNNKYAYDFKGIKFKDESGYLSSYVDSNFTLTNSLAWTGTITIYYVRIGNCVTLLFPSDAISRVVSASYLKLSTIPTGLRPLNSVFGILYGASNGTGKNLSYVIQNDGIIYVGNNDNDIFANFTSGTNVSGFYGWTVSYRNNL